jgi:hypothetical protein
MHYVYPKDGSRLPDDVAASVTKVPPGISEKYPQGGFFTADGVQVTQMKDGDDGKDPWGRPAQDPSAYMKVELTDAQLNQILEPINKLTEALKASKQ